MQPGAGRSRLSAGGRGSHSHGHGHGHRLSKLRKWLPVIFLSGLGLLAVLSLTSKIKDPEATRAELLRARRRPGSDVRLGGDGGSTGDGHGHGHGHHAGSHGKHGHGHHAAGSGHKQEHHGGGGARRALPAQPLRLMLASHGRLFWYYPDNDRVEVLHEGHVSVRTARDGARDGFGGVTGDGAGAVLYMHMLTSFG